jgi:cell division protein FtsQ
MTATRPRGAARVDPRLQARRASVAKRAGARRLRIIGSLSILATLAIVAIAIINSSWFDVETVQVLGAERADSRHIVTASGIVVGDALVEVDVDDATAAVAAVPWVAEATIDRDLDGTVTISVVERVGIVAMPAGSRFAMIDRTGQQLELVEARPAEFLPVAGVEASGVPGQSIDQPGLAVVSLVEALTPTVRDASSGILLDDERLQLELVAGGRADLGDERDLDEKLVALETILARVDLACVAVIDVRVPTAPTVRRALPSEAGQLAPGTTSGTKPSTGSEAADEEPFAGPGGC